MCSRPPQTRAARSLLIACLLTLILILALPCATGGDGVRAASPSPAAGDTRTSGEGAGLVGQPILTALGIVVLGLVAAGATTVYLRARPPH